ncbi:ribulose-phosphate 3-epimerase [Clostridia bacterium]|nr:ribulose-phosphate 3-epimerase [Clostridia bacterium]
MIKIGPSLLAADFRKLAEDIRRVELGKADYLHLDIMDGHFVPNISYGPDVVKQLRQDSALYFDVHLMIENPDLYLQNFKDAGANLITVHQEACVHLHRTIQCIKEMGLDAGVALNPATPVSVLEEIINDLDLVLIMSVNPGFGGQKFIPRSVEKIKKLKQLIDQSGSKAKIQVDGGVNIETASLVAEAGATYLVAGSAIYKQDDVQKAISDIRSSAERAID